MDTDDGLGFAAELAASVKSKAASEGVSLAVHVGLATGPVASGVLDRGSLTGRSTRGGGKRLIFTRVKGRTGMDLHGPSKQA